MKSVLHPSLLLLGENDYSGGISQGYFKEQASMNNSQALSLVVWPLPPQHISIIMTLSIIRSYMSQAEASIPA